jgi:hypothetical protein
MSDGFDVGAYLQRLREVVLEHGWAVQAVLGGSGDPPFAYTVGLTRYDGHPELVMYGLHPDLAHGLLNDLGARIRGGARLREGQRISDLIASYDVTLVEVDSDDAGMTLANTLYATDRPMPALMVVWPDPAGRFPWEDAYSLDPRIQPVPPRRSA